MSIMKQEDGGLEIVLSRNQFYRDAYRRVIFALIILFCVNCGLGFGVVFKFFNPPQPQYFPTTPSGILITINPLSDPSVSDDYVTQWAAHAVRQAFSTDYVHWQQQLQDASVNFTPDGWRYFLDALKSSNNLDTLTNLKMVSSADLTGAPQILSKAVVNGSYAWKIQMPILITYTDGKQNINMPWNVTLIVVRMPVQDYPQRIAINNFLPQIGQQQ